MIPEKIEKILELARWAPSGDNTQPWRFEVVSDREFIIHGHDTRDWCVYDLDGRASQIAIGALIENIAIAASGLGLRADFERRSTVPETQPEIEVTLMPDESISSDPLIEFIPQRVTQRRPFSTTPLTPGQKLALEASVGAKYSVSWVEGSARRWRMARLLSRSAKIRLTIPEAYEVHRHIIDWNSQYSEDKIPDLAVGLDPMGLKLMRWAMTSWKRVNFLNRYLAGTWLPRLQLDLLPGIFCGAHFLISANAKLNTLDDYLQGGRAMQRFWLTATRYGLQFQPEMTPLIFSRYSQNRQRFTSQDAAINASRSLQTDLDTEFGDKKVQLGVFMGRIGTGQLPVSRSTRLSLAALTNT